MKKYWIKDLKENQVIHAPTKEIAKKLCNKFHELGLKWANGEHYSGCLFWRIYIGERTCYLPSKGHVDNLYYYEQRGYEILTIDNLLDFQTNDYPKVMEVSDDGNNWWKRVVFMEKNGKFLVLPAETIEEAERRNIVCAWGFARDIKPKVKLTLEQVAEKFGVSVEQIEIVDNK